MTIKDELTNALKDAMKSQNTIKKNTVRIILANIKNAEIDSGKALDETDVIGVLQKQLKMRNDTLQDAEKIGRQDIIDQTNLEIAIIKEFLPEGIDEDQLRKIVAGIISEVGAESMRDMGKVMQKAIPAIAGKASNADISRIIRELLG